MGVLKINKRNTRKGRETGLGYETMKFCDYEILLLVIAKTSYSHFLLDCSQNFLIKINEIF